jgi:hypothetical protein
MPQKQFAIILPSFDSPINFSIEIFGLASQSIVQVITLHSIEIFFNDNQLQNERNIENVKSFPSLLNLCQYMQIPIASSCRGTGICQKCFIQWEGLLLLSCNIYLLKSNDYPGQLQIIPTERKKPLLIGVTYL